MVWLPAFSSQTSKEDLNDEKSITCDCASCSLPEPRPGRFLVRRHRAVHRVRGHRQYPSNRRESRRLGGSRGVPDWRRRIGCRHANRSCLGLQLLVSGDGRRRRRGVRRESRPPKEPFNEGSQHDDAASTGALNVRRRADQAGYVAVQVPIQHRCGDHRDAVSDQSGERDLVRLERWPVAGDRGQRRGPDQSTQRRR